MRWEKAPSSNIQAPEKRQASNSKRGSSHLKLGAWCFSEYWSLELGASQKLPPLHVEILRNKFCAQPFILEQRELHPAALQDFFQFA